MVDHGSDAGASDEPVASQTPGRDDALMARSVVVVDDHPGFRAMACRMLEDGGFRVIGEAADGAHALAAVATLRPRLVLLDVELPDMDGFAVADHLAETVPEAVIVLTSARTVPELGSARLAAAPVRGFIAKAELSPPALTALLEGAR